MSLTNDGTGNMVMPVGPMNGYGSNGMWGDGGFFWLLVLFIFAGFGNGGWGNGFNGGTGSEVQRGFDQQAVMTGINGINTSMNTGFNNLMMAQQNCCCENRLATANLSGLVSQEAAATRANTDTKVQMVMDKLCQLELDGIKQNYENRIAGMQNQIDSLRTQVTNQGFDASQNAQTAAITSELLSRLNPTPIPAYPVQNPNGCNCGNRFMA